MSSHGILFNKLIDTSNQNEYCDICGVSHKYLLQSEPFDNGNASQTVITFCESCIKNLSNLFIVLKEQKEEK